MSSVLPASAAQASLEMRSIIQRIATGPELSKDITADEARSGMRAILEGVVDPVQAAIFLIALRMKRETDEENKGLLDGIRDHTETVTADVDEVVDIADPYDGYNRTLPASPLLPALLAACSIPSLTHGVESMGPKYGTTHRLVLQALGIDVDLTPSQAAQRLANPDLGWAYLDQQSFCPKLHALKDLRTLIVKRPAITTVEVLTGPIRGKRKTHLMTGYVHKPYARVYSMLARHADFDSLLLVRGVEGGVIPSLRQPGKCYFYHDKGEEEFIDTNPLDLGIEQSVRAAQIPEDTPKAARAGDEIAVSVDSIAVAQIAAEQGVAALKGTPGPIQDGLIYAGALALWHLRKATSLQEAAEQIRSVIKSGKAAAHLGI